ncbi:hypothetical protein Misp06_03325 [Microbulbifer sp. NBRC 101763]|uniref:hypothetical protein n=1 Tax=Microbulbifer TaxID=48073 RepID=UPI000382D11D|nr:MULTISPECIES: hypothetical protein [Microbulbifer]WHI52657.1 hypothetical protein P3339_07805 [Microbulbifer sp. MLAF003]
MKSLVTPAVLFALVATYFCYEGMRLSVSGAALAVATELVAGQSLEGGAQQNLFDSSGKVDKKAEIFEGNEMMEFEGDIFADAPEHGGTERDSDLDKKSPGQRKG